MTWLTMCLCLKDIAVLTMCLCLKDMESLNDIYDNVSVSERYSL